MRIPVCSLLVATAALAACGGRVVVDGFPGEGGAGGTSGVSSSSHASSSHASSSHASSSHASSSQASSSSSSSGGGITCGKYPFPGVGAACNVPQELCYVPFACCMAKAWCQQGQWSLNDLLCQPYDCAMDCQPPGGFGCVEGAVCVVHKGKEMSFQCRPNPCAGPLDCACGESFCEEQGMKCVGIENGSKVLCK